MTPGIAEELALHFGDDVLHRAPRAVQSVEPREDEPADSVEPLKPPTTLK